MIIITIIIGLVILVALSFYALKETIKFIKDLDNDFDNFD